MGGAPGVSDFPAAYWICACLHGIFRCITSGSHDQPAGAHMSIFSTARNHPATKGAAWLVVAITLVSGFEGLRTTPYKDQVGITTVCYGETAADGVVMKQYTVDQCKVLLGASLPKYDAQIKRCLKPGIYDTLPIHRHAALVSFVYNVGAGTFCRSGVARDLNAGHVTAACNALLLYDRGGGKIIPGLLIRRKAERAFCLRND